MASSSAEYTNRAYTLPTGNDNDLTRDLIGDELNFQVQNADPFYKFIGPDVPEETDPHKPPKAAYPFVGRKNFQKESGDALLVPFTYNLDHTLVKHGSNTLKGTTSVQKMTFGAHKVMLANSRGGVGWLNDRMSRQRNKFLNKDLATLKLTHWLAQRQAFERMHALINGFGENVIALSSGPSATVHPAVNRFYAGVAQSDDEITSSDTLSWQLLERIDAWFGANNVKPCSIPTKGGGTEEGCIVLIHPFSKYSLRRDSEWEDNQRSAGLRGYENPLFRDAIGKGPGNLFLHETNFVRNPASTVSDYTNKRYIVAMGSHALSCGMGLPPEMFRNLDDDFGNIAEWDIDAVFGDARTEYTSDDGNATVTNQSSSRWTVFAQDPQTTA